MKPLISLVFALMLSALPARAADVTVAVASNFLTTAEKLAKAFADENGSEVVLTHGSTGQLFAQIVNSAPFDVFLAADAIRPQKLVEDGLASEIETYSFGRLVLVSRTPVSEETIAAQVAGRAVALADPIVAPYGLAATAVMESFGLDTATFQPILVANVGQAATVFATGNADFAFVAASLLPRLGEVQVFDLTGRYPPIRQDAARITPPGENSAADAFWAFLFSDAGRAIIADSGYDLP